MDATVAKSIVFPGSEIVGFEVGNNLINDNFMKDLKINAYNKTNEAVEFYALEMKVREFLTLETEQPLELEEWMTNEECWCPELTGATAQK